MWSTPSPFELALSLRPNSYLSHGTAAYLQGVLREAPATFHALIGGYAEHNNLIADWPVIRERMEDHKCDDAGALMKVGPKT